MAIEEPKFEVLYSKDDIEIRRYSPVLVAEVSVSNSFEEAGNDGFRPLGEFIFGNNEAATKVAMTAPVTQSEKISMTAPVKQTPGSKSGEYTVQFTMPDNYTIETLPKPKDPRVKIRSLPARTVAVLRYSGRWSQERFEEKRLELVTALAKEQIKETGPAEFARYNPPFWPWFLRRNEVWIPVTYEGRTKTP